MSFSLSMSQFAITTDRQLSIAVRRGALGLFSAIMKNTPVDTGSARMSWFIDFNSFSNEVKVLDTTMSAGAITSLKQEEFSSRLSTYRAGDTITLTNNSDHIDKLEFGLFPWANSAKVVNHFSSQSPRGFVRINLLNWNTFVSTPLR